MSGNDIHIFMSRFTFPNIEISEHDFALSRAFLYTEDLISFIDNIICYHIPIMANRH
jgi:hypothetical protein